MFRESKENEDRMSAGRVGQKNGQWLVLGAGLTVAALVLMVLFQPWVNTRSEMGGAGSDGPYAMGGLVRSSGISFPECAFVVVNWEVVAGKQTNFSVYPPDLECVRKPLRLPVEARRDVTIWTPRAPVILGAGSLPCGFLSLSPE
jgi:hypothetical protein